MAKPLAERIRPTSLDELVGQEHLTGAGSVLRTALQQQQVPSMILWGPPGVGKTTLAQIMGAQLGCLQFQLSAISSGVKEVREAIDLAKKASRALLFIDEIHRFNKAQQDALLAAVEQGTITLIGATTENPSFEVNSALLSRCQVYVLKPLEEKDLLHLLEKAVAVWQTESGRPVEILETGALLRLSGGDGRKLLNLFELVAQSLSATGSEKILITNEQVGKVVQTQSAQYDKQGEQHYDIISAFIKSIRGSDPHAAVYWLARMIAGGEDLKFIARRLLILASEDIGHANPNALLLANACFDAVQKIGYPESRIILSQCATYLACSAKSNASYLAIGKAQALVQKTGDLPVPLHLRNAPTQLMKDLDYGTSYQYPHDYAGAFIEQDYLPEALRGTSLFEPGDQPREQEMKQFLTQRWKDRYGK